MEAEKRQSHRIGISAAVVLSAAAALAAPSQSVAPELTAKLVDQIEERLVGGYIYEDRGKRIAAELQRRHDRGDYAGIADPQGLAEAFTRDLRQISDDVHLRILYRPREQAQPSPVRRQRRQEESPADHGFRRVEVLEGNVGYLDLRQFQSTPEALSRCDEAMGELSQVEALIIDLGRNNGGSEPMVRRLSAYLFAEETHLVDTFMRGMQAPRQRWTDPDVRGERLSEIPVYVLASRRTFSAAESFTFGLKVNGRITIVGERTGGGGHFGGVQPLNDGFSIWLPQGRTYDPKTGRGWEAEGIPPDIAVPYAEAREAAHRQALQRIRR